MGELLDALNALDDNGPAPKSINPLDRAVEAFRAAGGPGGSRARHAVRQA
jgi:hypothetical protein